MLSLIKIEHYIIEVGQSTKNQVTKEQSKRMTTCVTGRLVLLGLGYHAVSPQVYLMGDFPENALNLSSKGI